MMKYLYIFIFIVQLLAAQDANLEQNDDWKFERINFYFENDLFSNSDSEYTDGSRLSVLMYRPDAQHFHPRG